uniref:Uncharacterized protein n=1 Tax=Populus trichocarpa TaxID=3694 RepID=B9MXQ7_POPTR
MKCSYCNPLSLRSSFPGHLAELERRIEFNASTPASSSNVVEISIAGNAPQKEIGKCIIKILGEALQLSQPITNNSISVHMP